VEGFLLDLILHKMGKAHDLALDNDDQAGKFLHTPKQTS
jgi:hypothetical protein